MLCPGFRSARTGTGAGGIHQRQRYAALYVHPASGAGRGTAGRKAPAVPAPRRKILRRFDHRPHVRKEDRLHFRRGPELLEEYEPRHRAAGRGPLPHRPHGLGDGTLGHLDLRQCLDFGILCAGGHGQQHLRPQQQAHRLHGNVRLGAPRHVGHRLPRRTV